MRLYPDEEDQRAAAWLRWGLAGICVAAVHAGVGWWIVTLPVSRPAPPDTVQGIPIDLEPVAIPQNAPEPDAGASGAAAAPQVAASPAEPQAERPPASVAPVPPELPPPEPAPLEPTTATRPPEPEPAQTPPPQTAAEIPPVQPTAEPPPPEVMPPSFPASAPSVPEAVSVPEAQPVPPTEPPPFVPPRTEAASDAVVAPPPPSRPSPPKPDPGAAARELARRKAMAEKQTRERAARAEARAAAKATAQARAVKMREAGGQGPVATAPSSASSGADLATWRGAVQAHLRAFTPSGTGASGTARVAFAVDRSGRVVSATLAGSSGDAGLDAAAVAMVRRASPVPAPPPELGGRISVTVPVHFQ